MFLKIQYFEEEVETICELRGPLRGLLPPVTTPALGCLPIDDKESENSHLSSVIKSLLELHFLPAFVAEDPLLSVGLPYRLLSLFRGGPRVCVDNTDCRGGPRREPVPPHLIGL